MDIKFSINADDIQTKNGNITNALFKYLKNVIKNKTPLIMKCIKEQGFWKCNLYECAIPASKFFDFYVPATGDANPEGTQTYVSLTSKLVQNFVDGTDFFFKEKEVVIKNGKFKARDSYESSPEEVEAQLNEFLNIIENESIEANISWDIKEDSELLRYLSNLSSNPTSTIFVGKDITFRDDSFFFRTENKETFNSNNNEELFINMYVANKVLEVMDYCETAKLLVTSNNLIVRGFIDNKEVVKNISANFEATDENPSTEDLQSISPDATTATRISVDLNELVSTFDAYRDKIFQFIDSKNYEVRLYKNGNGVSFELDTAPGSISISKVNINVGEVEEEEPTEDKFTPFAIMLPLKTISNIARGNLQIEFVYDSNEDTAIEINSGNYKMLSGKLS